MELKIIPQHATSKGLTPTQAISYNDKQIALLPKPPSENTTPKLDQYKTSFILGKLKQPGVAKLRKKLKPYQMGSLVALKRAVRTPLTEQDELDEKEWEEQLNRYRKNPSQSLQS